MNGHIRCVLAIRLAPTLALLNLLGLLAVPLPSAAQDPNDKFDTSAGNLIAVLRESRGDNKPNESLEPYGVVKVQLETGRVVDMEPSWFRYLGDMHVRLVFDGEQMLQSASTDDLLRMKLSPEQALKIGIDNLKRRYGKPVATEWSGGLMQVEGSATELTSSYFLDREFWRGLQAVYTQGVVVAVPRRGGLVYAPASDEDAVDSLRFSVAVLYSGGPGARLSSALYLFKDGEWSVFQAPMALATRAD
ncbi:MAG: hypothetical protein H7255_02690 [Ramlibacter sp.]|nr:hypothetical protein [Ramlibacter sp.]